MAINIFEYAARHKIRFASPRGELSVEQLWDIPLRSKDDFNLNTIAQTAHKAVKNATEESFVETTRTALHVRLEVALDCVKHIIEAKLSDESTAKKRAENKLEREKLLGILAEKQTGKLSALTEEEIKKRIEALD